MKILTRLGFALAVFGGTLAMAPQLADVYMLSKQLCLAAGGALIWAGLFRKPVARTVLDLPLAALGAALTWVWPYAATWNSVREIGFRGATLCCGLVLVLCALRVYQHRAGPATRVVLGLAAGAGWWASPEIAYFVLPAVVLLAASWDRLYASRSGSANRWSAPWRITPLALTALRHAKTNRPPTTKENI